MELDFLFGSRVPLPEVWIFTLLHKEAFLLSGDKQKLVDKGAISALKESYTTMGILLTSLLGSEKNYIGHAHDNQLACPHQGLSSKASQVPNEVKKLRSTFRPGNG